MIPIHAIKLTSNTEFAERFNHVSDLFAAIDKATTPEERKAAIEEYYRCKLCLEQGYPIFNHPLNN